MKLSFVLDLKDWKDLERAATQGIDNCKVQMNVHEIMLANAVKKIKNLGGQTLDEEERDAFNELHENTV